MILLNPILFLKLIENKSSRIQQKCEIKRILVDIIWDQLSMSYHFLLETSEGTLKDCMKTFHPISDRLPFRQKKIVIFGEKFTQILIIINLDDRSRIITTSINYSSLQVQLKTLSLQQNNNKRKILKVKQQITFWYFTHCAGNGTKLEETNKKLRCKKSNDEIGCVFLNFMSSVFHLRCHRNAFFVSE